MEQFEKKFPVGLGAVANGFGRRGFGSVPLPLLAQYSPQIALAQALGVPFAPYHLNIRAQFTDSTSVTSPQSFEGGQGTISQPSICDEITYSITAPNAFSGNVFKSLSDFFYQRQSGIQATLEVQGAPRYTVSPYFTPIDTLLSSLAEGWPAGWVLNYTQSVSMQFQQVVPVPTYPTNIVVTFRLWQPVGTDEFQMMSAQFARDQLKQMGISWPAAPGMPSIPR